MRSSKISKLILLYSFALVFVIASRAMAGNINSKRENIFENINLEAKAVYIYDLSTNEEIWSKNPEAQLPLASLTKLMTVYVARKEGVADTDLACFTLTTSSNKYAQILADYLPNTLENMNLEANNLRLHQTYYLNPTGLDISLNLAGAYGSATDQAELMSALYRSFPELMSCTTKTEVTWNGLTYKNTNPDIDRTEGILGSKTGLTDLAGGNLAIIFDIEIDHPVIMIILGSSEAGRFSDAEVLQRAIRLYMSNNEQLP